MPADVNLWSSSEHALDYLRRADSIPHRGEGESTLLEFLPAQASRILDLGSGAGRLLGLVLDFTSVPYVDSAGVGALVGAYVRHQKDGHSLTLAGVNERVRNTLKVTQVENFFQYSDSVPHLA